ncbi:MAG: hypothetical protein HY689_14030 [Chloroflexi bacterium]|nr:hypothetical protein [Chloroflexota bacterium]
MERLRRDQRGQSLIMFAATATFLTVMVALVVDTGFAYLTRRELRNAADAASRAGANYVAQGDKSDAQISTLITSVAGANGCASPCTFTANYIDTAGATLGTVGGGSLPGTLAGVQITTERTIATFLARLVGRGEFQVSATASAIFGTLGSSSCSTVLPALINGDTNGDGLAFQDDDFTVGACYFMRDSTPGSSGLGWANLDGGSSGTSELEGWITNYAQSGNSGCNVNITVGTTSAVINTTPGSRAALQNPILYMITGVDPTGAGPTVSPPNNEIAVAIYDTYGNNASCNNSQITGSNLCYHVVGFGRMRLTDVWLTGNTNASAVPNPDTTACAQSLFTDKGIIGQFVSFVDPNGVINPGAEGPSKVVNIIQ